MRDIYKNTASMHNVDLYLLNDFTRANSRLMSYNDPNSHLTAGLRGDIGGNKRLVQFMKDNLATGAVTRTINGKTHQLGRTINWARAPRRRRTAGRSDQHRLAPNTTFYHPRTHPYPYSPPADRRE